MWTRAELELQIWVNMADPSFPTSTPEPPEWWWTLIQINSFTSGFSTQMSSERRSWPPIFIRLLISNIKYLFHILISGFWGKVCSHVAQNCGYEVSTYGILLKETFHVRSCISLIIILLMRDYTASPWSFHCKAADRLLIRPKGDWTGTFTYSTTAMNYKTLLVGLARLLLHNHEPDFQVFIWAVNSQRWLFHTTSGEGGAECTFGHSEDTGTITWHAPHTSVKSISQSGPIPSNPIQSGPIRPIPQRNGAGHPHQRGGEDCSLMFILFSFTHFFSSAASVLLGTGCRHGNKNSSWTDGMLFGMNIRKSWF